MQETIEKLLVLQDRDRKINRGQQELALIGPERETFRTKATATQAQLETARTRVKQIESDRKQLELDVEGKKTQIEKYADRNAKPSAPKPRPPRRNSKPPGPASNKSSPTANSSNSTLKGKKRKSRNTQIGTRNLPHQSHGHPGATRNRQDPRQTNRVRPQTARTRR